MDILTFAILLLVALIACAFAVWPILRRRADRGRYVLAAAVVALVLGIGGGSYLMLGAPQLALRTLQGDDAKDLNAMIGKLAIVVRERPNDPQGWALLGRAYLTANDPNDAAKAFSRAIAASKAGGGQLPSFLLSAYGEALTQGSAGAVTPEAEAAFTAALTADPRDKAARYYLGLARTARGDTAGALVLWKSLLADMPPTSPVRQDIINRMADLSARSGAMPDINAMVAALAARLKTQPDDPAGWQRLVRSYAVLGDKAKARAALADARKALAAHKDALATLDDEARTLGL